MAALNPYVRCICPSCGYDGPHRVLFTDTEEVVIDCGNCGESFMAAPRRVSSADRIDPGSDDPWRGLSYEPV